MTEPVAILIPLLNPNEPGALLVDLHVIEGQHVRAGDLLCTLETTKSTAELRAEGEGFVVGLGAQAGDNLQAGSILAYLADSPGQTPPSAQEKSSVSAAERSEGLRISQPALLLAQQHNLDLSQFPEDVFITRKMVQDRMDQFTAGKNLLLEQSYAPESIIIYGGGGHGKALIDLLRMLGTYSISGIIDDGSPAGKTILDVPVLGGSSLLEPLAERGLVLAVNAVGGIGNIETRIRVFDRLLQAGYTCPALVHPTAFVEPSASLAEGVQVMPHAYVGSDVRVGFGVIVNTGAIVSHDCILGNYVNLSPGAILAGEVSIGNASLVGMGVTINLQVHVGERARIGNGATVKQDVPVSGIVHAGTVWPL